MVTDTLQGATTVTKEKFPTWRIILFSFGGTGVTLIATLVGLATYFYVPPGNGQADFPAFLPTNMFLGMTIFGLILFVSNLPNVFLYPFVASWSDNSKAKMGRRKVFLVASFIPIAILSYMIFTPPVQGVSNWNAIYLFGVFILLSVFKTFSNLAGAIPPEYSSSQKQLMYFSIFGSVGWVIGYLIGSQAVLLIKNAFVSTGMTVTQAFHITVGILITIGCLISIFQFVVLDEKRYGEPQKISVNLWQSLKTILKHKDFVVWTFISIVYSWGDVIFNTGLVYYVTVNYQINENMMIVFGGVLIGISLILYPLVNKTVSKFGKKRPMMGTLLLMALCMVAFAFPGVIPLPKMIVVWIIVVLVSIYSAYSGVIPGAIGNEIIREGCIRTGIGSEATYTAANSIISVIPASIPALVIPSVLLLGKTEANHVGVTVLALIGGALMVTSFFLYLFFYHEGRIVKSLKDHGGYH